jgi:hypothetical protein
MSTANEPDDAARVVVTHKGDPRDSPYNVALANAAHCPACAYLTGIEEGHQGRESGARQHTRALFVGRRNEYGTPLPSLVDTIDARRAADAPGPRPGDWQPKPVTP